ncbi:MAG: TIGR02996 domain-containing protein [Mariniblastus sp.]
MHDEFEILEFLRQSPDDLSRRLVYADWLEERGSTQADYVRIVCSPHYGEDRRQRREALELWRKHVRKWNGRIYRLLQHSPLGNHWGKYSHPRKRPVRRWIYARGCIEILVMPVWALREHLQEAIRVGPVNTLKLKVRTEFANVEALRFKLKKAKSLKSISRIDLRDCFGSRLDWIQLLQLESLSNIVELRLGRIQLPRTSRKEQKSIQREFLKQLFQTFPKLQSVFVYKKRLSDPCYVRSNSKRQGEIRVEQTRSEMYSELPG